MKKERDAQGALQLQPVEEVWGALVALMIVELTSWQNTHMIFTTFPIRESFCHGFLKLRMVDKGQLCTLYTVRCAVCNVYSRKG